MRKSHLLAVTLSRLGAARALDAYWGRDRLTVLAYHRITDPSAPGFDGYEPNVSATPEMFARQMDWIARRFTVIDLAALRAFVTQGTPLPPRPLLITFDDGYLDNYQHAAPVLRAHGFPAVIFLITDKMDDPTPPWWDVCAACFRKTRAGWAVLPLLGERELYTPAARRLVREEFMRRLKTVPEDEKQALLDQLPAVLEVTLPAAPPLFVSWEQVRELVASRIACQPHTATHPILTRIPPAEMRRQIAASQAKIAAETGQEICAFAYPNGTPGDYDRETLRALNEARIPLAFTLAPGPLRAEQVRRHPLEIARVFLSRRDSLEMFGMKVMGLPALADRPRFIS